MLQDSDNMSLPPADGFDGDVDGTTSGGPPKLSTPPSSAPPKVDEDDEDDASPGEAESSGAESELAEPPVMKPQLAEPPVTKPDSESSPNEPETSRGEAKKNGSARPKPPSLPPPKVEPSYAIEQFEPARTKRLREWLLIPRIMQRMSGFFTSAAIHMALLLVLALLFIASNQDKTNRPTALHVVVESNDDPEIIVASFHAPTPLDAAMPSDPSESLTQVTIPNAPNIDSPVAGPVAANQVVPQRRMEQPSIETLMTRSLAPAGGGFEGRTVNKRARLLAARGGTPESENAVAMALGWLAAHQLDDGSWRFDHNKSACSGLCRNPGNHVSTTGSTALALLPFLGAGHTHRDGEYKDVVKRGLYYLSSRMIGSKKGGDLREGTMYAHGIATVALCEAYALTQDPQYKTDAQMAIDFICNSQHSAGGWRYFPGQPGDTTVFGWQIMALKSGHMAKLHVPSPVIELAKSYLDTVQLNDGALYGYQGPENSPTPTAVGLLSRMYTGWSQNDERLERGVIYLDALGPSRTDMYFNYYATQVLIHQDGPAWPKWNNRLREHLIKTQGTRGHERGSWYFNDKHSSESGGRLYNTAMSAMILEVYYRHMPLYGLRSIDDNF